MDPVNFRKCVEASDYDPIRNGVRVQRKLKDLGAGEYLNNDELVKVARCIGRLNLPEQEEDRVVRALGLSPASASHHLAFPGGLALHSANVTEHLLDLAEAYKVEWASPLSPFIIGLCHDLCKTEDYLFKEDPYGKFFFPKDKRRYRLEKMQREGYSHGSRSAELAPKLLGFPLTVQETLCIQFHMGAWDLSRDYTLDQLDAAIKQFPREVILTHTADMLASQYDER